jgi:hypothetical protein
VLVCSLLVVWLTRAWWIPGIARGLVCSENIGSGDAILVENFDQEYLPFERAGELRKAGVARRVLVPTSALSDDGKPNLVSAEIVAVMARIAQLPMPELIPIREVEPISLNAACQIRDVLRKTSVRSVVVVSPAFRSRRSFLVYDAVFAEEGISTSCVPVFGNQTPETWVETWHGILNVAEQYLKLLYYRLYILPHLMRKPC